MLAPERTCLLHEWTQGNYVEGGTLEGRIDWDALDSMAEKAMEVIEYWIENSSLYMYWSGGVDAAVVLHMLYRMDAQDDVPCVTFRTPEHYPSSVDYVKGMADRWGFDLEHRVHEGMDIEWVAEDDKRLFPIWEDKTGWYTREYRNPASRHQEKHGYEYALTGRRNEHTDLDSYTEWKFGFNTANPLYQWEIGHVIAYLDKHSIPIPEAYHELTTGANHPWHRELSYDKRHDRRRTIPQCWYMVRRSTVRFGYTSFWTDHILEQFPEGEELAAEYAASEDKPFLPLDDGPNYGADATSVPANVGPET